MKESKNNRRNFLLKFIGSGVAIFGGLKSTKASNRIEKDEMIKMLSSDGQVMLVPRSALKNSKVNAKTKNVDILNWKGKIKKNNS